MIRPAVLAFNASGTETARRIADAIRGETFGLEGRVTGLDATFDDAAQTVAELFRAGRPLIGVCAAGILVRLVAPLLRDKRSEPPVIAASDDGAVVVPVLGGLTGGDALARLIADALGGSAAITGAGVRRYGINLEAPPQGFVLANPEDAKGVTASLLAGATARLDGDAPWIGSSGLPLDADGEIPLRISTAPETPPKDGLLFHPQVYVAEFSRPDPEMLARMDEAFRTLGLAPQGLAFATAPEGAPIHHLFAEGLAERRAPLRIVEQRIEDGEEVHAEPGLVIRRFPEPVFAADYGREPGRVIVVGLGPGQRGWLSPEASSVLERSSDLVGYEGYLALAPERVGQRRHGSDNRVEIERARAALALASSGKDVAIVSSGDSGIFGMAAALMEVLAAEPARWPSVEIGVTPGISAMQAAASRLGAPLGHDFAVISLSDQLKPWPTIARRLDAAAGADFAMALYNPASLKRRAQLEEALEIIRRHRAPTTPVALARSVGRKDESVTVTTLGEIDPAAVNMQTLLVIGSSRTRTFARADGRVWMYTPRVYEADGDEASPER